MARRGRDRDKDSPDVRLSKFLSYICRHGAEKEGLPISDDGFVTVSSVLSLRSGKGFSSADVQRVVAACPKQRFALREASDTGQLQIRANQGHSMEVKELELTGIVSADEAPLVVHGTYKKVWQIIQHQGLSRMKRTHIHCAAGLPGESGVISGMRASCQVLIFIDLEKALEDGIQFFRSANGVVLSPGNEEGLLLPKYFKRMKELT